MHDPELSVILCTYNREKTLGEVLSALTKQILDEDGFRWELVLVDNNSSDGTIKLVQEHDKGGILSLRYVLESQQGKSFALNSGIENARGDLLAFTDDDVILDRHWISSICRAFRSYPNVKCFGGKVLPVLKGKLPNWLTGTGRYTIGAGPLVKHDWGDRERRYDQEMWGPPGCNMFFRKELVHKYGNFSTDLGFLGKNELIGGEDSELMSRFKRNGVSVLYYPGALVYHPTPEERLRKSYFKRYSWGAGRGGARWNQIAAGTTRYCNVPRYLLRLTFRDLIRLLVSLPSSHEYKRFYFELQVLYKLGMIYEYYLNGD